MKLSELVAVIIYIDPLGFKFKILRIREQRQYVCLYAAMYSFRSSNLRNLFLELYVLIHIILEILDSR